MGNYIGDWDQIASGPQVQAGATNGIEKREAVSHTPGPFTTSGGGYIGICAIIKGVSRQIGRAEVVGTPGVISDRECEANASLFAASPDLLQALKALLDISPFSTGGTMDAEIHRQAEAAIAKAERS